MKRVHLLAGSELDDVRSLIRDRAKELGVGLADLGRLLGKSSSYIHCFLYKGTPERLPLEARATLARVLKLDPRELDPRSYRTDIPPKLAGDAARLARTSDTAFAFPADIPLFRQGDVIDPDAAREWTPRPSTSPGAGGMFALEVQVGCIRAKPGDVLYVANRTPRIGDLAVCLNDRKVEAIGELSHMDALTARLQTGVSHQELRLHNRVLLKVTTLVCA